MPGAGTDKTRDWVVKPGPIVVLVEPQLGENIGAVARAMANFGLARLRLVKPLQGWPNEKAKVMAAGADRVLDGAALFETLEEAVADCTLVLAATARNHDQAKPVIGAAEAALQMAAPVAAGENAAIVFGRERNGLENHEVALADTILTLPVNPAFASLNLGQAVLVVAYEWFKHASGEALPFAMPDRSPPVQKEQLNAFFDDLERELERVEFFRPEEKRGTMSVNLRNIFTRMKLSQQDVRTLHGVLTAIAQGRKGPARGGVLNGTQAQALRDLIAGHAPVADETGKLHGGPARGLAKLLRRNPTDAERVLWQALVNDRRIAGRGFKRQVPVGRHMTDFVSFPLRVVIDLLPAEEDAAAASAREVRRVWLAGHDYRVIEVRAVDVETNIGKALDDLAGALSGL